MQVEIRPCTCNKVHTGLFYDALQCLDCWSYYFDPYWSKVWQRPTGEKPPHPLLENLDPELKNKILERHFPHLAKTHLSKTTLEKPIQNTTQNPKKLMLPCINLGTIISRANCNCAFKFIHKCDIHGTCIRGEQLDSENRSCLKCKDYQEDTPLA
jgi:hypothetical protein